MFTFSFGSAFATISWTGEATNKYLTEEGDYKAPAGGKKGEEGITEAYKAELTKAAKAMKSTVKDNLYAPEKEKAAALLDAYIADVAAAKTAKAALELTDKLGNVGTNIDDPTNTAGGKVAAKGALGDLQSDYKAGADAIATSELLVDVTRLVTRYDATLAATDKVKGYFLPGYGYIENSTTAIAKVGAAEPYKYYLGTGTGTKLMALVTADPTKFIKQWLMDNDYRTAAELETGLAALVNALVPVTTTYVDTVNAEADALQREIYTYADKYDASHAKNKVTVADLEAIDALIVKINAYNDKYGALTATTPKVVNSLNLTDFDTALTADTGYAYKYFDAYCADLTALPLTSKLADADKAKVLDLYKKFNALEDTYGNVWKYIEKLSIGSTTTKYQCPENFACSDGRNKLNNAYEYFLKADVKAFSNLADFDAYTVVGSGPDARAYFDASEKNVSAMKAQRTAFNALVSDYGYSSLDEKARATMSYALAANVEAKLLAGEHNHGADADYDVKDTKKLQDYLNNATLKVTTKALGNNKIRVNARFDAETYKDIVAECGNDYTISYKFYQKSAKATSFKGPKEKSRNYITYTKASLKKGTKYKFQCGVVIKDAQGNVVAEKSYKASTTGSRICR